MEWIRFAGKSREEFEVWSYYKALHSTSQMSFPWKILWKSKVPTKVRFFVWTAALGRILAIDNLRRCRIVVINWCCMCKRAGETSNHSFLHCSVARKMWNMVFSLFGVYWVMLRGVVELLASWSGKFSRHRIQWFGTWSFVALCGVFGGRGMLGLLKGVKDQFTIWSFPSSTWTNALGACTLISLFNLLDKFTFHAS